MKLTISQMETNRYQFESFCKKIIREAYFDHLRRTKRIAENEITFSELDKQILSGLSETDEYSAEYFYFQVNGTVITIKDDKLYHALSALQPQKRNIILLSIFLDKSDVEIAKQLNMVSRTVQYQRKSALTQLKKTMEGNDFEQI